MEYNVKEHSAFGRVHRSRYIFAYQQFCIRGQNYEIQIKMFACGAWFFTFLFCAYVRCNAQWQFHDGLCGRGDHVHCICGGGIASGEHTACSDVTFSPYNGGDVTYDGADGNEMIDLTIAKWTTGGEEPGEKTEKGGLSGGAIVGITIGSVAVAEIGGFSIFWFAIKKKRFADLIAATKDISQKK